MAEVAWKAELVYKSEDGDVHVYSEIYSERLLPEARMTPNTAQNQNVK